MILDECGVCGGTGILLNNGNCCTSGIIDECGVCEGAGIPEDQCDCVGNVLDECGVCNGDDSTCKCNSPVCLSIQNVNIDDGILDIYSTISTGCILLEYFRLHHVEECYRCFLR